MAIIKPYDASQLAAIEKSIRDSDLGVNPTNDGTIIRVVFPQLTEERRRDLGKVARARGEDAKVSIRAVRRHAKDTLDKLVKDSEVGEDDAHRAEGELDKLTAKYTGTVDEIGQGQGSRTPRGLSEGSAMGRHSSDDDAECRRLCRRHRSRPS